MYKTMYAMKVGVIAEEETDDEHVEDVVMKN